MRAVNLLPRDIAKGKSRDINAPLLTGVVAAVIVTVVLAAGFLSASAKVSNKQTELDAARAELALIPAPATPDATTSNLANQQTKRVAALQNALNGRIAWDRVLREISLVLPEDVWLSGLTLSAPVAAPVVPTDGSTDSAPVPAPTTTAPVTDFTMNGKAFSHQDVAQLLTRLALVPDFSNVTLGHSTRVDAGARDAFEFSVTAGIRTPGSTP